MIPVKVEIHLMDGVEREAFNKLMTAIEQYRVQRQREIEREMDAEETVATGGDDDNEIVDAVYEADQAPVIATITPNGALKVPSPDELNNAATAYMNKHGLDKALALVREFGVARVGDLKDPQKQAALYERFTK